MQSRNNGTSDGNRRNRSSIPHRRNRLMNSSPSSNPTELEFLAWQCWYHHTFGIKAKKCHPKCKQYKQGT